MKCQWSFIYFFYFYFCTSLYRTDQTWKMSTGLKLHAIFSNYSQLLDVAGTCPSQRRRALVVTLMFGSKWKLLSKSNSPSVFFLEHFPRPRRCQNVPPRLDLRLQGEFFWFQRFPLAVGDFQSHPDRALEIFLTDPWKTYSHKHLQFSCFNWLQLFEAWLCSVWEPIRWERKLKPTEDQDPVKAH